MHAQEQASIHTNTHTHTHQMLRGLFRIFSLSLCLHQNMRRNLYRDKQDKRRQQSSIILYCKIEKKGFLNGSMCYIKQLLCGNFSRWIIKTARSRTHTHTHKWLGRSGTQVSGIAFSRLLCGQKDYSYLLERVQFPNPSPQQNSHRREQATWFSSTPRDTLRNASQLFIIFSGIRCLQVVP